MPHDKKVGKVGLHEQGSKVKDSRAKRREALAKRLRMGRARVPKSASSKGSTRPSSKKRGPGSPRKALREAARR